MDGFSAFLGDVSNPVSLLMLVGGVLIGLVVGALPGVGGLFAMALLLPLTNDLDIYATMGLLIGIGSVVTTSDTLPAILIGVPGSAAAIATVEDGHPLAQQGQAGRALGASYSASMLGGLFGALVLALAIPVLRPLILSLRTPDFLAVSVLGLLFVAAVSGKAPLKGVLAALLGVLLSMVGLDAMTGAQRFTLGNVYFWDGLSLTIVFVGLFGLAELIELLRRGSLTDPAIGRITSRVTDGIRDTLREWRLVLGSSGIGTLLGAIPGIGVTTIDWVVYGLAKRRTKSGPPFGQGNIRGVIAPESANNAKEGGNLIPTLALGLPGEARVPRGQNASTETVSALVADVARSVVSGVGERQKRLRAIAVAVPRVVATHPLHLNKRRPPDAVLEDLRRAFNVPAIIENNVNCAALGEWRHGAAKQRTTFAFVQVGVRIGMGLVINGQLFRGMHGAAGEVGRLPFPWAGDETPTREGLEHYLGSDALIERCVDAWPASAGRRPCCTRSSASSTACSVSSASWAQHGWAVNPPRSAVSSSPISGTGSASPHWYCSPACSASAAKCSKRRASMARATGPSSPRSSGR